MSAGYKYYMEPEPSIEERYDVSTGVRRRGPYKLDTTNLVVGSFLPSFTPIAADLVKKTAQVAIRVEVYEKFTTGSNTTLKIKKNSLAYVGMHIGDGSHGATINAIDKSDKAFDKLTLAADFGATVNAGTVLFEATAVNGTTPKVVANSALYERKQIDEGPVLVALLMRAFEIEPTKLAMPFHAKDKENLPHFQFNE
ncbi:head fiber protein [Phocaeicola plebeius]|uniref:head fiber protein n=1 Tax=Phocaeicola plebeius TaxID=310297 RepID=UPI003AF15646